MNNPLVSIIIPVYNRENIIEETVRSATNQTYEKLEIIISDNCSSDNTWQILQKLAQEDKRIVLIRNEENLGPVRNWKVALNAVSGEYCKILWSDDLITDGYIDAAINVFDEETAFVLSGYKIFDSYNKNILGTSRYQKTNIISSAKYLKDILISNRLQFPVSPGAAFFRSKDLLDSYVEEVPNEQNLKFKNFGAGNDVLFYLITANKYPKIKCIQKEWSLLRQHKNSLTVSNNLDIYYEYANLFFIKKYYQNLIVAFKSKIYIKDKLGKDFSQIYKAIDSKLTLRIMIETIQDRLYNKFIRKF